LIIVFNRALLEEKYDQGITNSINWIENTINSNLFI